MFQPPPIFLNCLPRPDIIAPNILSTDLHVCPVTGKVAPEQNLGVCVVEQLEIEQEAQGGVVLREQHDVSGLHKVGEQKTASDTISKTIARSNSVPIILFMIGSS